MCKISTSDWIHSFICSFFSSGVKLNSQDLGGIGTSSTDDCNECMVMHCLYCLQPDLQLIPYEVSGTVATPAIKDYATPDGEYIDVSKKWDN